MTSFSLQTRQAGQPLSSEVNVNESVRKSLIFYFLQVLFFSYISPYLACLGLKVVTNTQRFSGHRPDFDATLTGVNTFFSDKYLCVYIYICFPETLVDCVRSFHVRTLCDQFSCLCLSQCFSTFLCMFCAQEKSCDTSLPKNVT